MSHGLGTMGHLRRTCERGGEGIRNVVFHGEWWGHCMVVEQGCGLAQKLDCNICHCLMEIGLGCDTMIEGGWVSDRCLWVDGWLFYCFNNVLCTGALGVGAVGGLDGSLHAVVVFLPYAVICCKGGRTRRLMVLQMQCYCGW